MEIPRKAYRTRPHGYLGLFTGQDSGADGGVFTGMDLSPRRNQAPAPAIGQ